jgi:hypothetical protein
MAPPELEFAFEARITVGAPLGLGRTAAGERRIIPITGGTFAGPKLTGRILPGGADWQLIRADGVADIDARYTLETDAGELIYVANRGLRHGPPAVMASLAKGEPVDPAQYYFRTVPTFETAAAGCAWLTRALFIGVGERRPDRVVLRFWEVL